MISLFAKEKIMIFDDTNNFSSDVEHYVKKNGGGYIEAILELCETNNIEPQVAAKFLTQPIIEKIQTEGEDSNLLPKGARLPI
tara:strand:+ start:756 stop:1004 length:249 start_codon:yes stop_codon:yes gene_type:complete